MTTPLITLPAHAPVIEGLMAMARYRVHHLVLTESEAPDSPVVGVISGQDIAHVRGHDPVATLKCIEQADSPATLAVLRQEAFALLRQLRQQGMKASDLLHLNSTINDRIVARILKLIEAQQQPDEEWAIPWAWMALGSEGRQEMSFKTDQDNALIYADPYSDQRARWAEDWLGKLALQANAVLEAVGFARCPADIMASNPHWRQSISSWKHTLRRWISYPDKKIEMQVSALLDLRAVYGGGELVEQLKVDLQQAVQERRGFLTFMMRHALRNRPPLSFLGRFVLDRSGEQRRGFDLKLRGLMPITDLARVLALEAGYVRSSGTLDRLHTAAAQLPQVRQIAQDLQEAYRFLVELQLDHQLQQIEAGKPPDHYIVPEQFTSGQRKMLKLVFSIIQKAQEALAAHYGASA
jgi:CBS domain-containing protein